MNMSGVLETEEEDRRSRQTLLIPQWGNYFFTQVLHIFRPEIQPHTHIGLIDMQM